MGTETITDIDARLITARWAWWHATWAGDADQLVAAMDLIDALLERRHALAAAALQPALDSIPAEAATEVAAATGTGRSAEVVAPIATAA